MKGKKASSSFSFQLPWQNIYPRCHGGNQESWAGCKLHFYVVLLKRLERDKNTISESLTRLHLLLAWDFSWNPLPFFTPTVLVPRRARCSIFPSSSSLSSISQIYSIFHHHINPLQTQHLFCYVNQFTFFPPSFADSIKQCPKSTRLSVWEWFITKREVFVSVCRALQCKITSFIFHIASAAALNIPVSTPEQWDPLDSAAIRQQHMEQCTNNVKQNFTTLP